MNSSVKSSQGVIPVVDEHQHCIGVITDRDIVIRGIAEKREGSAAVKDVMSTRLLTGSRIVAMSFCEPRS